VARPAGVPLVCKLILLVPATVLLLVAGTNQGAAADRRDPVRGTAPRVYVFTADAKSVPPTEDEQGLLDSVRDLRDALRRSSKIAMASDAAGADVLVEVVDREKRDAGGGGFGGTSVTAFGETIVRLRVTFGSREAEIKGIGQAYWARAAKDAAERLVKWIVREAARPSLSPASSVRQTVDDVVHTQLVGLVRIVDRPKPLP
jgi:hypothetical protein